MRICGEMAVSSGVPGTHVNPSVSNGNGPRKPLRVSMIGTAISRSAHSSSGVSGENRFSMSSPCGPSCCSRANRPVVNRIRLVAVGTSDSHT